MRKTSLSIVITLLFLNTGIFLQPDDSHGANSKDKTLKPLQYFVDIGRLPDGIKKQLEEKGKVDVIITLNDDDAQEKARQMRTTLGIGIDNAAIIDEKARIHTMNKGKVLSEIPTNDFNVLKDYDKFPVIYIEVNENALKKLLHNPAVKIVGENNKYVPLLAESTFLIGSWLANFVGVTGAGTAVAVLDSGVDYTLPAFNSCAGPGQDGPNQPPCRVAFAQDFAPDDLSLDDNGHGTRVSGIVVGVAPGTRILGLDVFSSGGAFDDDILDALIWVINNRNAFNIKAVNLSLGIGKYTTPCPQDNLASAISALKAAGVLTVIASGNDGFADGIARPACIPDAISVGAVYDQNYTGERDWCQLPLFDYPCPCIDSAPRSANTVICWSNSAPFLTMLAPGAYISVAGYTDHFFTSLAAPHVAGAIAAIGQVLPGLSVDSVRAILTSTGAPATDAKNNIVKPRLDLWAATPISCPNAARIEGGSDYSSLEAAYNDAVNGNTIQASKSIIIGDLTINKSLTLQGGYDMCNFTPSTGYTFVQGDIHISSGTVEMGHIVLMR